MGWHKPTKNYTVSIVLHQADPEGSGKMLMVEEVLDTDDYGAAVKMYKKLSVAAEPDIVIQKATE